MLAIRQTLIQTSGQPYCIWVKDELIFADSPFLFPVEKSREDVCLGWLYLYLFEDIQSANCLKIKFFDNWVASIGDSNIDCECLCMCVTKILQCE